MAFAATPYHDLYIPVKLCPKVHRRLRLHFVCRFAHLAAERILTATRYLHEQLIPSFAMRLLTGDIMCEINVNNLVNVCHNYGINARHLGKVRKV